MAASSSHVHAGATTSATALHHYAGLNSRTTRVHGQSISISAEELGGDDLISANVYRTRKAEHLRPCEVSEAKVLAFLRGWTPA